MPLIQTEDEGDSTIYTVDVVSKNKPDFGAVENEELAEKKAKTALMIRRRMVKEDSLEHMDTRLLREMPFSMRAEYRVKFRQD